MNKNRLQTKLKGMVEVQPDTECWEWIGQISNSGRGRINLRDQKNGTNSMMSAAMASHIAFLSDVPDGYLVRQTCTSRLCINPEHLELFKLPQ